MSGICPCTFGNNISKALFGMRDAKRLNCNEPEQTASATVISRKVERTNQITNYQESPWLYLVTFLLDNQEELTLQVKEDVYTTLKEETQWTIIWQGEQLVSFS